MCRIFLSFVHIRMYAIVWALHILNWFVFFFLFKLDTNPYNLRHNNLQ